MKRFDEVMQSFNSGLEEILDRATLPEVERSKLKALSATFFAVGAAAGVAGVVAECLESGLTPLTIKRCKDHVVARAKAATNALALSLLN